MQTLNSTARACALTLMVCAGALEAETVVTRAARLEGEVARAADVVARARAQEAEALAALAQRKAEHAVVERDKEKFRARAKKAVEQKEDEAGDEAFASKWVRRDD